MRRLPSDMDGQSLLMRDLPAGMRGLEAQEKGLAALQGVIGDPRECLQSGRGSEVV
jgi:hypothetical protein